MDYITRCPHCQVCFNTNHTQLEAYQGFVRCGSCSQAFNAKENLLEPATSRLQPSEIICYPNPSHQDNEHSINLNNINETLIDYTPKFAQSKSKTKHTKWILGTIALFALLAAQVLFSQRNYIAQNHPEYYKDIQQICTLFSCDIRALQDTKLLSIESSDLSLLDEQNNIVKLNAIIRNRAHQDQMLPSIMLILRDTQNQTLAQKVISPKDYFTEQGQKPKVLTANSELIVNVALKLGKLPAAGFQLDLYYP